MQPVLNLPCTACRKVILSERSEVQRDGFWIHISHRHGVVRCPSHEFRPNFCLSNWIMVNVHLWDGHHPVLGLTWLLINNLWLCAYWLVLVFVLSHIINSDCLWMTNRESWNKKITTGQGLVLNNFSSVVYAKMPPEPSQCNKPLVLLEDEFRLPSIAKLNDNHQWSIWISNWKIFCLFSNINILSCPLQIAISSLGKLLWLQETVWK